jgi:mannose-6-phosphate isomerase-like protein (cupin superfamily)
MKTVYEQISPFTTKDGSEIRELLHPNVHGNHNQSFAEATIAPGGQTVLHRHATSEEIYHVTHGQGLMTLGSERFAIAPGDTILIPAGTPHNVRNTGTDPLRILCCCAPPYSHADTELL